METEGHAPRMTTDRKKLVLAIVLCAGICAGLAAALQFFAS